MNQISFLEQSEDGRTLTRMRMAYVGSSKQRLALATGVMPIISVRWFKERDPRDAAFAELGPTFHVGTPFWSRYH